MNFLEKLRNLSNTKKIIIFFVVMGVAALATGFVGMRLIVHDLSKVKNIGQAINLPKIEIPEALKNLGATATAQNSNEKTYASEEYHYQINYPSAFTVIVSKTGAATFINSGDQNSAAVNISVVENTKAQYDAIQKGNQDFDKCEKVTLALEPALEVTRCEHKDGYLYEIVKSDNIYWADTHQTVSYDPLLDNMMKTFKFN